MYGSPPYKEGVGMEWMKDVGMEWLKDVREGGSGGGMEGVIVEASPEVFVEGVAWKDLKLDGNPNLWVRIFLPQNASRLPVVLYCHGGAYCLGDPALLPFHGFCHRMASQSRSIWISLAYRLAPAHKLPAAFHDGLAALHWLQSQASSPLSSDPWLHHEFADFSNCFLAGESAGATISLDVALKAAPLDLSPLRLRGLLLVHPGFHSEANRHSMVDAELGDLQVARLYDMALPDGQNLDYPPINPFAPLAPSLAPLAVYPHILVASAEKDFRREMTLRFCEILKELCQNVRVVFTEGKGHIFHLIQPGTKEALDLESNISNFISSSSS